MRLVLSLWIVILEEVAAQESRKGHRKVRWRRSQRQESTFASRLCKIEGEYIDHRGIQRLRERNNNDEDNEVDDVHSKKHRDGPSRFNRRTKQNQVIRVIIVLEVLHAEQEDDDQQRCYRHVDSKRRIFSVVLNDDLWQHEEQQSKYELRSNNNKAEQKESPELVVTNNFLEYLQASQLVDFRLVILLLDEELFFFGVVEAQENDHNEVYNKAKELHYAVRGELLLAILLFASLGVLVLVCY